MNNTQCLNGGCLDEREAFEAYARRDGLNVTRRVVDDGLTYVALATENAWQIWQASRRSMPDTRFAAWCIELLTKAESRGLHLDADKQAILTQARASQSDGTSGGAVEVGVLTVSKFRGHLENTSFDYTGNLPDGTYSLFVATPSEGKQSDSEAWISVNERLPAHEQEVICTGFTDNDPTNKRWQDFAWFHKDGAFYDRDLGDELNPPTHWREMPALPPAPTQGENHVG